MTRAVKAVYENGVFKPRQPVDLQEQTEVEVLVPTPSPTDDDDPTGWKTAEALMGFFTDAPEGEAIAPTTTSTSTSDPRGREPSR